MTKQFTLAQILNMTSGKLYSNMDDIYMITDFFFGKGHTTLSLPHMRPFVVEKIMPQLSPEVLRVVGNWCHDVKNWRSDVEEASKKVGLITLRNDLN